MQLINDILLFSLGIIVYIKKPQWVVFYWISLEPVMLPFSSLITRCLNYEEFFELTNHIREFGRNYLAVLILIEVYKTRKFPQIKGIGLSLSLLMSYISLTTLFAHFSFSVLWGCLSEILSLLLMMFFLSFNKRAFPSFKVMSRFMIGIIILQFLWTLLNLGGIYIYLPFYIPYIDISATGSLNIVDISAENLVSGTFARYNSLANFLTTIFLFISLEYYSGKIIFTKTYYLLSAVILGIIVLTGAKISLVLFFLIFLTCCTYYIKEHFKIVFMSWGIVILGLVFLSTYDTSSKSMSVFSGIDRQLNGLASFVQSDTDDDHSTVALSTYLLNNYFDRSPLLGSGLSYKGEFAYGNWGNCTLTLFRADARIAYMIVEYGIIGFLLYFTVFISIFIHLSKKIAKEDGVKLLFCFVYYILLTITEPGFFDRLCFPLLFVYVFCVLSPKHKSSDIIV